MTDGPAALRIGEVARRTGVAVATLRAWERRYGLLEPERTEGGHRLYREADVERVRAMVGLLDEGWSAGAAAREVQRAPAPVTPLRAVRGEGDPAAALAARLRAAIDGFDVPAAEAVIDDVLARLDIGTALDEVILPVLREVGDGWQDDPRVIAREHVATNTIRPRLQRLMTSFARSARRICVAAAPEHEEHDLGLLAGAVIAADAGWRVHYLGPRTPTVALERAVAELDPQVVLVGAVGRDAAVAFLDDGADLGAAAVVIGGAGFRADDVRRLPGSLHHDGEIRDLPATIERALEQRDAVS